MSTFSQFKQTPVPTPLPSSLHQPLCHSHEACFNNWAKLVYKSVYLAARSILSERWEIEAAEEATQNAFLKLWLKAGLLAKAEQLVLFSSPERAKDRLEQTINRPYACKAGINAALDLKKRQKRNWEVPVSQLVAPDEKTGGGLESLLDHLAEKVNTGRILTTAEAALLDAVNEAMAKLPEVERRALEMKFYEDATPQEIAVACGKSLSGDKDEAKEKAGQRLVCRAMARLATILVKDQ